MKVNEIHTEAGTQITRGGKTLVAKDSPRNTCAGCHFVFGTDCHDQPGCKRNIWVEQQPAPMQAAPAWTIHQAVLPPKPAAKPMILSADPAVRKSMPITTGVLDYFPLALAEVAKCSKAGNDQHNPGQPLHWDQTKSTDHADCIARHLIDRGTVDTDGIRHSAKLAWRALANLQMELQAEVA